MFSQTYKEKIFVVSQQLSEKIRMQINRNALTRQRGVKIVQAQRENYMIRLGIAVLTGIKLMWSTTAGDSVLIATTRIIIKYQPRVTRWEAARGTNIGR